jgi:hypothetical protein
MTTTAKPNGPTLPETPPVPGSSSQAPPRVPLDKDTANESALTDTFLGRLSEESRQALEKAQAELARKAAPEGVDETLTALADDISLLNEMQAAAILSLPMGVLAAMSRKNKVLALDFGVRGRRYPKWQFEAAIHGVPLEEVLEVIKNEAPLEKNKFFNQNFVALNNKTPIEALRNGERMAVIRVAEHWVKSKNG